MGKYLLKRLINYAIMFFVVVSLSYFLCASQLDPRLLYDITNPNLDWDSINASLSDKNLNPDEPIISRYFDWLNGVVHGDWGEKPKSGSVNDEIANRVPVSFRLVIGGFLIGSILGIILGAWSATRQYKPSDRLFTLWSLADHLDARLRDRRRAADRHDPPRSGIRLPVGVPRRDRDPRRARSSPACSTAANTCCCPR